MALKFGRTSGITSRIDPVTGTTMYTEDEYDAYNTAVEAEQERKSAYDASMAKFKTESDVYYGKSAVDTKEAARTASMLNASGTNKLKGGQVIDYKGAGEMTQAESDKMFDERLRKGEIVPFNDKSITDLTRKLYQGNAGSKTDLSKIYFDKGTDFKSYRDMYGDNFNPEIWEKDAKAGKESRYGDYSHPIKKAGFSGHNVRGVTPVKPAAYVPANLGKEIKAKDVDWKPVEPMVPLKPTKVDPIKSGKLRPAKEEEVPTWEAPILEKKKATHMRGTRITGSTVTDKGKYVKSKTGIENAARIKISDAVVPQRIKYNTEKRQSAAYYGNETVTGEKITGKTASELKSLKQEVKGDVKRMRGEGRLKDARDVRGDLPQIRKAIRYTKKADLGVSSVTGLTMEGDQSTLRYFTPERTKLAMNGDGKKTREDGAMAGYKDVQRYNNKKAMEQTFKGQSDNPANKNTVANQQAKLAEAANTVTPSYKSQMREKFATANPGSTPRQIRQGVRTQQNVDEGIMRAVDEKIKKNKQ